MRAIERKRNAGVRRFQWLVWKGVLEEPGWVTHNKTWAGCLCPVLPCPDLSRLSDGCFDVCRKKERRGQSVGLTQAAVELSERSCWRKTYSCGINIKGEEREGE